MALLEIAVDTAEDGIAAVGAGADRLEVCSNLQAGGCTPDPGVFRELRSRVRVPLFVMLRPREGPFVYSAEETTEIIRQAKVFREDGADGLVTGLMTGAGEVDEEGLTRVLGAAGALPLTFHRAVDTSSDRESTMSCLIKHGISRILTSGGAPTAEQGIPVLREDIRLSAGRVIILPGGGVRPSNIEKILHDTGAKEIHSSGRDDTERMDTRIVSILSSIAHLR